MVRGDEELTLTLHMKVEKNHSWEKQRGIVSAKTLSQKRIYQVCSKEVQVAMCTQSREAWARVGKEGKGLVDYGM